MEKAATVSPRTTMAHPSRSFLQKIAFWLGIGVWRADQQVEGYLFLLPSLIGFLVFVLAPILISLALSFHDWDLLTPPDFIGAANYVELFTRDPVFGSVLKNTVWYTILIVPVQLALGFLLAIALNSGLRALRLYRMLYFMPVVASVVAAAMVFRFLFNQQSGVVAAWIWQTKELLLGLDVVQASPQLLAWVQGIEPPDFLNAPGQGIWPGWAIVSVALFTVWKNVGFTMVIYLAALQAVPEHLYDAAKVDGASGWQRLRYVTIPLVSPTTFFLLIIQMLGAFQLFTEPFVMVASTQDTVTLASESLVMYIYRNGFNWQRMGKAAAISWVLFAIVFAVTILQTILQRRWVHYETD
jgi:multiple sugar transport system permease protein